MFWHLAQPCKVLRATTNPGQTTDPGQNLLPCAFWLAYSAQFGWKNWPWEGSREPQTPWDYCRGLSALGWPNIPRYKITWSKWHWWLRIRLPMQETRVRALVREDPTCLKSVVFSILSCKKKKKKRHWSSATPWTLWFCSLGGGWQSIVLIQGLRDSDATAPQLAFGNCSPKICRIFYSAPLNQMTDTIVRRVISVKIFYWKNGSHNNEYIKHILISKKIIKQRAMQILLGIKRTLEAPVLCARGRVQNKNRKRMK